MTVCIGALATEDKDKPCSTVVVASDRMVTMGGWIEFEHEIPKITELTPHAVALVAGDALRGSKIVQYLKSAIGKNYAISISKIAEIAGKIYTDCRDQQIDTDIFRPRGFTRQQFYQELQSAILQQITFQLDNTVASFDYGVDLIIAGYDDTGGHLYEVRNPGGLHISYRQIGYHSVGSGAVHAMQSMIGFRHAANHDLQRTLFSVYIAKKRGEVAPGVGTDTDMAIIREDGIHKLTAADLNTLEDIAKEYFKPIEEGLLKRIETIETLKALKNDKA